MGFELGNHGYSHNYLDGLNKDEIKMKFIKLTKH